ncbi:pyridoxamine 5'-phosphate oxidase family protein [Aggregatilinea lenta]|uniref:pyridoxamine 5'-phosphate oxidase family protein n=1 Tax=Aggregatilinea lenta TaxID=913108 RepID=UPI000E5C22DD|nr:pyridoxamine 5'-phosphate oxidase family protein [Aggregatilinea lenta]
MNLVPDAFQDLFHDSTINAFAVIATVTPNGIPVTTPIWFLADEDTILFSAALNSVKHHNIQANPSVSLCVMTENNHVRYVEVRGQVTEITREGWSEFSRRIKQKYPGGEDPSNTTPPNTAIFKVTPSKVFAFDYS